MKDKKHQDKKGKRKKKKTFPVMIDDCESWTLRQSERWIIGVLEVYSNVFCKKF